MKYYKYINTILFITLFSFISCNKNEEIVDNNTTKNEVSADISNNSFNFTANTTNYQYDESYDVIFQKDSIQVTITVSSFQTGSLDISVYSKNTEIFSKQVQSQINFQTIIRGLPDKINIKLNDFSGIAVINIKTI
ncbi:hypothetical protein ABRY23_06110 [Melioribacteraceae bacterium 4301-Me]|uniref:hypothetical protein n=1 Tax=Pyranulibacter aquaticus TaxID=3163344 RepID=UPI00359A0102